uniref:RRM domain-containing protein n=1 Tax=Ditylenchus dipsaci TaxID=166011 RepID=A0A915DBW9_9BILA
MNLPTEMPVLVQLKNVPPKATICQIFSLFSDLNYEPEEITLMERRRDSVFFEMVRLDLAYRAVQLSGRLMLSHSILVAHATFKELLKFRADNKGVPMDNSCYVPLPSPLLCPPSFSGSTGFVDYNDQILHMLSSTNLREESFSPAKQRKWR